MKSRGSDSSQVNSATEKSNEKTAADGTGAETLDSVRGLLRRARSSATDAENVSQQQTDKKKEETGTETTDDQRSPLRRSRTVAGPEGNRIVCDFNMFDVFGKITRLYSVITEYI